ncbi:MAG: type II toxin-antitoxin system VapC family toxin [Burkholderiales bacterium]|nr:type II toxin-antitoxin system VapC family toxin [Burkholderiales bacterium]
MTKVLVDSNVILDVVKQDSQWSAWSAEQLERCADRHRLVINPVIFSEVSIGFDTIEEVVALLPTDYYEYAAIPWSAAFLAGKCFVDYRRRRGVRTTPLPDFFIGAHAAVDSLQLLTRDATRYRTYFPTVQLICPDAH